MSKLSPPWYTLWNEINASIGNDPDVTVKPLDTQQSPFIVPVQVGSHEKAEAIASILDLRHIIGNITVDVEIRDQTGTIVSPKVPQTTEELAKMMETALGGNGWFSEVIARPIYPQGPEVIYPVFKKEVIQFFNDDLSDVYSNYNNVAAFVFKDVLNGAPGGFSVYCSTAK